LTINGGTYVFNLLTNINGSSVTANGASVTLPAVTSYSNPNYGTTYLQAENAGGVLSLPYVATIGTDNNYLELNATSGGILLMPLLTSITNASPYVQTRSQGSGSKVDFSSLTSYVAASGYGLLSVTQAGTVLDPNLNYFQDVNLTTDTTSSFTLASNQTYASTAYATTTVVTGTLIEQGSLALPDNATIDLKGALALNGLGLLVMTPTSTLNITGNLSGTTTNADRFAPLGTVVFNGGGGASNPQTWEAMSNDLGATQAGFQNNFAFGTVSVTANTYVQLVDNSKNSTGTGAEAVYVNELVVPSGATLDLNGLHLYVRGSQIAGTILNGTITEVPGGGAIQQGIPTAGNLGVIGQIDNWTFFGRSGETVTVALNPGSGGSPGAVSPQLNDGLVELLDSNNNVIAQATSTGSIVTLSAITFTVDGVYTIRVEAPASAPTATGNYVLSLFDVTPHVNPLVLGQTETSTLEGAFGVDQWGFSAQAGEQIQFHLKSASPNNVVFNLSGPGGYVAFTNLTADSGLITLPSTGQYVLAADGIGGLGGSYTFEIDSLTITPLTLGTIYNGTLAGAGQSQLFAVNVPTTQTLFVNLNDGNGNDVNELYARLGAPPTRADFTYSSATSSPNQQILVSSAAPGTWYFLVYSDVVAAPPQSFTLVATGAPVTLSSVEPAYSAFGSPAMLTLQGAGFNQATTAQLVASDGTTTYNASNVSVDTYNQITANFDLSKVPEGLYSVRVTRADGTTS
ncbi:MAG: PPC domain-containing protein, partial [Planctomycetota bacterium]|nr:PPC domain-containing protein [Planctomycetota bacterium]